MAAPFVEREEERKEVLLVLNGYLSDKLTQNSTISTRTQHLITAWLHVDVFFLCIAFKGHFSTQLHFTYLPFSFLGDTLKHIVYQAVCVEFDRSSWGFVPRVCDVFLFLIFISMGFVDAGSCWSFVSWPLWRRVNGKLYYCSKNCPFYCSVLKREHV